MNCKVSESYRAWHLAHSWARNGCFCPFFIGFCPSWCHGDLRLPWWKPGLGLYRGRVVVKMQALQLGASAVCSINCINDIYVYVTSKRKSRWKKKTNMDIGFSLIFWDIFCVLRKPPAPAILVFLEATSAMNSIAELPGVKREQLHFLSGTWDRFFWSQSSGVRWDWLPMFHEEILKLHETMTIFIFNNATKLQIFWHFCFVRSDLAEFFFGEAGLTSCAGDMMLGSWMASFLAWTLEDANVTEDVATHELSHLTSEIRLRSEHMTW